MSIRNCVLFFLLICITKSYGQIYDQLTFKNFSKKDGLSDNTIKKITLDDKGFLWVATENKLNRFDGKTFKHFELSTANNSSNICYDLIYTSKKELFVLSENQVLNYNEAYDKLEKFKIEGIDIHNCFLGTNETKDSTLYFWGPNTISRRIKQNTWQYFKHTDFKGYFPHYIYYVMEKSPSTIWVGANDGVYELNIKDKISKKIWHSDHRLYVIKKDAKNRTWVTTQKGIFISINDTFKPIGTLYPNYPNSLFEIDTRSIVEGTNGEIIISTDINGLLIFKSQTVENIKRNHQNGLSNNQIWTAMTDKSGNLYTGHYRGGINISNRDSKYILKIPNSGQLPSSLPGQSPTSSFNKLNDSTLSIATDGEGLFFFNLNTNKIKAIDKSPKKIVGTDLSRNKLWIATWNEGIYSYDLIENKFNKVEAKDIGANNIPPNYLDIKKDSKGWYWVTCLDNGLFVFNPELQKSIHFTPQKLGMHHLKGGYGFRHIYIVKKQIWASLLNGIAIFEWENDSIVLKKLIRPKNIHSKFELISNIKATPYGLLIASKAGIYRIHPQNHTIKPFIPSSVIFGEIKNIEYIKEHDIIIMSTSLKVYIYHPKSHKVIIIDENDGIEPGEFINSTLIKLDKGIALGGTKGFYMIANEYLVHKPSIPNIYIEEYFIDFVEYHKNNVFKNLKAINNLKKLPVLPGNHTYTLRLGNIDPIINRTVQYEYKIDGYQKDWIKINNSKEVTFNKLPRGEYTLLLRGKYEKEDYSEPISYIMVFPTEFYQTWWFRLLGVIVIVLIIYIVFRIRTNTIKKRNKILEERVVQRTKYIEEQKDRILEQRDEIQTQAESLQEQHDIIATQKFEMEESIEVSKRIQQEAMSNKKPIKCFFTDYSLLFKQRDPVGGDFFWNYDCESHLYLAVGDCTGHGVAGGMLTLIAINILNAEVSKDNSIKPGELLNQLNLGFRKTLQQDKEGTFGKDGLDISLIKIEKQTLLMEYSGAVNPVYIKSKTEINKLRVNPISIGVRPRRRENIYLTEAHQLQKGDYLLFFSDGITDQLSIQNDDMKKFGSSRVTTLFEEDNSPENFINKLTNQLSDWRYIEPQTDDMICLIVKV